MTESEIESTVDHLDRIKHKLLTTKEIVDVAVMTWYHRDPREGGETAETFTTNSARLRSAEEITEGGL